MFGHKNKNQPEIRRPGVPAARQNVFSYHANRSTPESVVGRGEVRREAHDSGLHALRNLPAIISGIVIVAAGIYATTLSTSPRVAMSDDGQQLAHSQQEYQDAAAQIAGSSLLNRSKLTVDTANIESRLRERFPEIRTVEVTVPLLGRRPVVEISTIRPVFTLVNNSGEYFIASDGRATAAAGSYAVKPKTILQVYDQSGVPLKPGNQILTKDTVAFITAVILQMQAKNVKVASMTLPTVPYELQMRIDGAAYYVRFNTLGDARLQSGTFLALKERLDGQKQKPAEYIDVRVEDRAFYK
jgi:hypothetical protein